MAVLSCDINLVQHLQLLYLFLQKPFCYHLQTGPGMCCRPKCALFECRNIQTIYLFFEFHNTFTLLVNAHGRFWISVHRDPTNHMYVWQRKDDSDRLQIVPYWTQVGDIMYLGGGLFAFISSHTDLLWASANVWYHSRIAKNRYTRLTVEQYPVLGNSYMSIFGLLESIRVLYKGNRQRTGIAVISVCIAIKTCNGTVRRAVTSCYYAWTWNGNLICLCSLTGVMITCLVAISVGLSCVCRP
jgi:hypothetical protein